MKQYLKNSAGYSLLLAVAVLMIFTVLGLSLLTLTTSGLAKNEARENIVQATDLAEKGVDFLVADIQNELNVYINSNNISKGQFHNKLMSLIQNENVNCKNNGIEIAGDFGNTTVCIDTQNIENVYLEKEDGTLILQELKKKVPIQSTGIVNGKAVTTTTKIIIGTDAVPDQLRYALSTNNGGNLFLHGGIEVHGDIKTDNNLILSSNATWMRNSSPIWQPSVRTKLLPSPGSTTPKIIFSKEDKAAYELKKFEEYNNHVAGVNLEKKNYYNKFSANTLQDQKDISKLFFNSPQVSVLTKTTLPQDSVEITNRIQEKYNLLSNKENYINNLHINSNSHETRNFNKQDVVFVSAKGTEKVTETYIDYEYKCVKTEKVWVWIIPPIWGEYQTKCIEQIQIEVEKTRVLNKDTYKFGQMTINNGNKSQKQDVTLKGTYYVYGDLTINNVNLTADAIIYVQGKVDISNSTIQGADESTLIIFSNGNIDIYNMSVDKPKEEPSKIKGFFYTKQDMIMYGVGSHINLTGGISSRRLILTGVRGNAKNESYLTATQQETLINGIAREYPRLKIIYDQDLISTYTEFVRDKEEEYIKSISDPELVDRY